MALPRLRYSFSLKTLLFLVTLTAILLHLYRTDRAAKVRSEITAELTADGCVALLGCQAPHGTAPEHASQEIVYVSMGNAIHNFQDVLKTNYTTYGYYAVRGFYGRGIAKGVDLSRLPQLPELRVLNLADRVVTPEDLRYVGRLPNLEVLVWNDTQQLSDIGLRHLSGLLNLRFLDIPYSQVTDEGLAALADLESLEHLNLHGAKITGSGLRHLQNLKKLRSLYLSNTRVDDDDIAHLRGLKSLEKLVLHDTRVTDDSLVHLRGLPKLTYLDVSRTRVSLEAMESLRKNAAKRISIMR